MVGIWWNPVVILVTNGRDIQHEDIMCLRYTPAKNYHFPLKEGPFQKERIVLETVIFDGRFVSFEGSL